MKKLNTINKDFNAMKLITIVTIVLAFVYSTYNNHKVKKTLEEFRENIYVLKDGAVLELAMSRNANENRAAEVDNHIRMFHDLFYNMDPDAQNIKNSINKALHLIDDTGLDIENIRQEKMYYHKLIKANMSSRIQIDSIQKDMSKAPYVCKIYGRQKLIRKTKVVFKKLVGQCQLRNVRRTNNNPHGLLIERYSIIDNSIYSERKR